MPANHVATSLIRNMIHKDAERRPKMTQVVTKTGSIINNTVEFSYQGLRIKCERHILGIGGFNVVFRGRCDDKIVAIKRIQHEREGDDREEQFLTQYRHPNILHLYHIEKDLHFK